VSTNLPLSLDHLLIDDTPQLHKPISTERLPQYVSQLVGGADELNLHPALINAVSDVVAPCVNVFATIV
jgi:hypothetical protein